MKNNKIRVLIKRVGQPASVEEIENTLDALQEIVGGDIEIPYNPDLPEGVQLVCNEEGKYADDPQPNIYWGDSDVIYGDMFFMSHNKKGEAISLTEQQIEQAKQFAEENDASDFMGDPEVLAYANAKVLIFGSNENFYKTIAGDVFEGNDNSKPQSKNGKGIEM